MARPGTLRRQGQTRIALQRAALTLFVERSADAVAVDDITRRAAVAKGSFYNHFDDKADLARALISEVREAVEPVIAAANQEIADPAARTARAVAIYARFAIDHPIGARFLTQFGGDELASDAKANHGIVADLAAGLETGCFALATIETGVLFVAGVTRALMLRVASGGDPAAAILFSQQAIAMLLRGLGVEHQVADAVAARAVDAVIRRKEAPVPAPAFLSIEP